MTTTPATLHPSAPRVISGQQRCPACSHPAGSERITRGDHLWPFNKPRLLRCCHRTDHGPAVDLGHDVEVCNCADPWHTAPN